MIHAARFTAALVLTAAVQVQAGDAAALYRKWCMACHAADGSPTRTGERLGATDLKATKLSVPELEKVISEGRAQMLGFKGKLPDAEIKSLATYVKSGLK